MFVQLRETCIIKSGTHMCFNRMMYYCGGVYIIVDVVSRISQMGREKRVHAYSHPLVTAGYKTNLSQMGFSPMTPPQIRH